MKIALAIEHLDPHRGGAELWTQQHAEQLLARGHEVHVVAQDVAASAERLNIVAHRLGPIRSTLARAQAAEAKLRSIRSDMIHDIGMGWHSHIFQSPDGSRLAQWERMLLLLPSYLRPCKRAMIRSLPRYRDFRRLMARQFGDPNRLVLAISRMCAQDYQQYHDVPEERIRLVYHGVDNDRFSPVHRNRLREPTRERLGLAEDETMFLFVGHDYRRKGLATAIRAIRHLAARGGRARLVVVGGKGRTFSLRNAESRGLVTWVGADNNTIPYYAAADAVVLPSFYDPFGLVVLEGAASGLPVVTTRSTGASELLTDGQDGYVLADPSDDQELASRLAELLDPALRGRMGAAARRVAMNHTLDRSSDEIISLYQEISGRSRRAA